MNKCFENLHLETNAFCQYCLLLSSLFSYVDTDKHLLILLREVRKTIQDRGKYPHQGLDLLGISKTFLLPGNLEVDN